MSDLTLLVAYDWKKDKFDISGNVKPSQYKEIIINFLRSQIGAGIDDKKPEIRDNYKITINLDLGEDIYKVSDDCGNKGLRDGILGRYIQKNVNKRDD